jgi:hypothetical protein
MNDGSEGRSFSGLDSFRNYSEILLEGLRKSMVNIRKDRDEIIMIVIWSVSYLAMLYQLAGPFSVGGELDKHAKEAAVI